jgi:hypothetical protein
VRELIEQLVPGPRLVRCGRHQFATLPGDDRYLQGAKIAFDDFAFVPIAEVYDVGVFKSK